MSDRYHIGDYLRPPDPEILPAKIVDRVLEPGKWKLNPVESGYEVADVFLIGLRGRPTRLRRVSAEEFFERHPKDEDGKPMDSPFVVRGVPSLYTVLGHMVYLWPAPAHRWTIRYEFNRKAKSVAGPD